MLSNRLKQVAVHDLDPALLFDCVLRYETVIVFISECAAQSMILERANLSDANMYRNLNRSVYLKHHHDSTRLFARLREISNLRNSLYCYVK